MGGIDVSETFLVKIHMYTVWTFENELLNFYHFLQDARSDAEEHIYSKLNLKISEFIELGMSFFPYYNLLIFVCLSCEMCIHYVMK